MRIAFCTTCKGRAPHIQQTLLRNIEDNADHPDAVFVLLDYNSQDGLGEYVHSELRTHLNNGRLVYYRHPDAPLFRMTHAKNMAHRLGIREGGDVLVNLDADNFTGRGFACSLSEHFERTKGDPQEIFMWARMIKGSMARGISGRLAVTKNAFLIAGGYDEKYDSWASDDRDFNCRLRRLGYNAQEIAPEYLMAINHNDKIRFKDYPHLLEQGGEYNEAVCQISRVINDGNVGVGTVYRNFSEEPIDIKRIPTRIFGIGLHKTATTSLHAAFQILGYKSGHWENAHWAKAVWSDVTHLGRSPSLDRFYALSDLPFPLLYKQLDYAYPGSKFILTVRKEGEWLASVEKHFDHASNPFRATWSKDPFTLKVHTMLYGTKGYDAEVFLRRYRQHNAEVVEYFKDRPNDLLVLPMSRNSGDDNWQKLCGFLREPVPAAKYPVKMATP